MISIFLVLANIGNKRGTLVSSKNSVDRARVCYIYIYIHISISHIISHIIYIYYIYICMPYCI